jgi:cellulose synthase/poly-beta-1,6-N-acetylglucosamine synthase-like glycosyltransferase
MIEITIALVSVIALPYAFLILTFGSGWKKKNRNKYLKNPLPVSIIIPFRNEEKNLSVLLKGLVKLEYPANKVEIILADDHSQDRSNEIIKQYAATDKNIRLLKMPAGITGKKETLRCAISAARGEIIITTDADCIIKPHWVEKVVAQFAREQVHMVIGPVMIKPGKGLFTKLQELEFFSLLGSTGGAVNTFGAIMCNAANLAFRKKTWVEGQQNHKGQQYASGDDMFLLESIKKNHPQGIVFLKDYDAVIFTRAENNLFSFLQQRIRWASKSSGYTDKAIIITGITTAWINIFLALSITGALFYNELIFPAILLFVTKACIDLLLLFRVSVFAQRKKLLWLFPFLSVIYPFYVTLVIFLSFFVQVKWKGRKY